MEVAGCLALLFFLSVEVDLRAIRCRTGRSVVRVGEIQCTIAKLSFKSKKTYLMKM